MCPFCLATAAMIAGSATGTGAVTALIAGAILKRNKRRILPQGEEAENGNDSNSGGNPEDGVAR
ncbi:MAG TPA: hypothetical protein VKB47_05600 [Terracidiphilus sp.]|nr:hypothetical protein [Terracidiphilus sp.]